MTTTQTSGAAIQRYKIGYHADEWGQRSSTPSGIPDASGSWVRYADHVTALAAGQATAAPAQPAAQQGVAYAALPTSNYAGRVYEEGFLIGTCQPYTADQLRAFADATYALRAAHGQAPADAAPSAGAVAGPDDIDAIALTRYKVVHSHDSMFHRFAVVAGDGKQQLYLGRETECQNMARKFAGAFLDGAFYQANITPSTQAAGGVPAVEREQERIAFKDAHRHLELYEVPDAWGRPMFKHSHVEASWLGWIARASRGQAPATEDSVQEDAARLEGKP